MKILLAGPGTGKTTRVKEIIDADYEAAERALVLSFTNATVSDLTVAFADDPRVECLTLHKYALKISPLRDRYILDGREERTLRELAKSINTDFAFVCERLRCITFEAMISECLDFLRANPVYAAEKIGSLDLLIVDEYQDFNPVEQALIDEIAGLAAEAIILGDDDQCIYGFKDADPDGIMQIYQEPSVTKLDHANNCWRCPDVVVTHAQKLIEHNVNRVAKTWNPTGRPGDYSPLQVRDAGGRDRHPGRPNRTRPGQSCCGTSFLGSAPSVSAPTDWPTLSTPRESLTWTSGTGPAE